MRDPRPASWWLHIAAPAAIALAAVLALSLTVADGAHAASDIGRNIGQEINSWGSGWCSAWRASSDCQPWHVGMCPGALVIRGLVLLVGGFVFAPSAVEDTIVSLWKSVGAGR